MSWKVIHRWLGLTVGTLAVVLGITGSVLAIDPVQQAWQAPVAPGDLPVAMLVERGRVMGRTRLYPVPGDWPGGGLRARGTAVPELPGRPKGWTGRQETRRRTADAQCRQQDCRGQVVRPGPV